MKIIDRYVIRQLVVPSVIGLLVFTFLLMLRPLQDYAENLVAKNIPVPTIVTLLVLLIPQALALTIPMALLLGLLVGFGRLSADREFVAMQACGISLKRLLLPVGIVSFVSLIATGYVWFYGYPNANQNFREVMVRVMAERAEGNVRPHVFFRDIPNLMLYVRDVPADGSGWDGVFMSDTRSGATYTARHGAIAINRSKQTVDVLLDDGAVRRPVVEGSQRQDLDVQHFDHQVLSIDPTSVFAGSGKVVKGLPEMTITELLAAAADRESQGQSSHNEWVAIHQKFAIPFACVIFGVIGLALGATHRRDGALGSFVLGLIVVFAYYIPLYLGPQMVKGEIIPPWLAAWLPNIVLGCLAIALFVWRERVADQPIRLPSFLQRRVSRPRTVQRSRLGFLRLLDSYVTAMYVRILFLSAASLMAVFYISTFIDRADKLFKGQATPQMLVDYFTYLTPQYIYYVIPLAVLLATLVTIAVLTRNNELIVMKACGVSLYRIAAPMFVCALLAAGTIYVLDESVVGPYFERAERLRLTMNGQATAPLNPLSNGWIQGNADDFYYFRSYDPTSQVLIGLTRFEFSRGMTRLTRQTYAEDAKFVGPSGDRGTWRIGQGWTKDFNERGDVSRSAPIVNETREFESAAHYGIEQPEPKFMRLSDLTQYTERMIASGYDMFAQQVWIARRYAFPFVTLIMTLIAVPFAVTVGRGGAMAGIAVGIGLALVYWVSISIFAALGSGGMIAPVLAAWAPNMLFGAGALYLVLTVRT